MKKINSLLALAAVGSLLTACSQGQSAPPVVNTANLAANKLQFAVGTATIVTPAGTIVTDALNVVSTFRQPNGLSAVLLDTPTVSGPWTLPSPAPGLGDGLDPYSTLQDLNVAGTQFGPSLLDYTSHAISGTPQTVRLGTPTCDATGAPPGGFTTCPTGVSPNTTTFGQAGGAFGMGIQPANSTTNTTPYSVVPYSQPIFQNCVPACTAPTITDGTILSSFTPWGGPPAFDDSSNGMGTRDGLHNLGAELLGWNTGVTVVQLGAAPAAGGYTMNVSVPTGQNQNGQSNFMSFSATANLNPAVTLPAIAAAPTLTEDGAGGGTLTAPLLPGATEGYVTITDLGPGAGLLSCQGTLGTEAFPVYYTIKLSPGTGTYTLPDTIGPNTTQNGPTSLTPSMTLCTGAANTTANGAATSGDVYSIQEFQMDYPLYEASYPANKSQTPAIRGTAGQADITISAPSAPVAYTSNHRKLPMSVLWNALKRAQMSKARFHH